MVVDPYKVGTRETKAESVSPAAGCELALSPPLLPCQGSSQANVCKPPSFIVEEVPQVWNRRYLVS